MDFDRLSRGYDTEQRARRAEKIAEQIRAYVTDGAEKSAMEYGCGTGLVGMRLAGGFGSLHFMDSSQGMITEVRKKIAAMPHVTASVGDLAQAVPTGLRFDCIFSSMALHHIRDTKAVLARFYGVLNEGGRLIIVDLDKDDGRFHASEEGFDGHNGFCQGELKGMLAEAGYEKIEIRTFFRGQRETGGGSAPYSLFVAKADKPG